MTIAKHAPPKRVVVGFNVFLPDVGPVIQPAPEHSEAFRRRVLSLSRRSSSSRTKQQLSLDHIKSHPTLARLLVRAKRNKVQRDYARAVDELDRQIDTYLRSRCGRPQSDQDDSGGVVTVQELVDVLAGQQCGRARPHSPSVAGRALAHRFGDEKEDRDPTTNENSPVL